MGVTIRIEDCAAETRAAAFKSGEVPFALFQDRSAVSPAAARCGQTYAACLSNLSPQQGGGFATLESGETVFLKSSAIKGRAEGERFNLVIEAERRRGKVARARIIDQSLMRGNALEMWQNALPDGQSALVEQVLPGDDLVASAFDEALSDSVTLTGGGTLRISETPALVAVDVDTAGRTDAGRAYQRALKINQVAAEELARQLSLRGLGGGVVLDCVSPLRKETGSLIKQSFLTTFRSYSARKVEALAPSPFGLMEIAVAWRRTPVSHIVLDESGELTIESQLLAALRSLERELARAGSGFYELQLPQLLFEEFAPNKPAIEQKLISRYGARFRVERSARAIAEVHKL